MLVGVLRKTLVILWIIKRHRSLLRANPPKDGDAELRGYRV